VLVIVMGLMIVVGFVVVASEIARRMSSASTSASPAASASGASFAKSIALPSGAQVVSVEPTGDRIVAHVRSAEGRSTLYILDPRNGALLGTVDFPPGAVR
jgi:hypothetical protein